MHGAQAVALYASWNVPAAQSVQLLAPAAGCAVPGLHGVGSVEPMKQKDPAGQAGQSSTLASALRSPPA